MNAPRRPAAVLPWVVLLPIAVALWMTTSGRTSSASATRTVALSPAAAYAAARDAVAAEGWRDTTRTIVTDPASSGLLFGRSNAGWLHGESNVLAIEVRAVDARPNRSSVTVQVHVLGGDAGARRDRLLARIEETATAARR